MSESLEDRLRSHAAAFDGLLQLIPAKLYYGEDTSDQWQKKKQTKEEARAAKFAKLDPDNAKSARDVMDENARKRKREEEDQSNVDGITAEKPKEGLKETKRKAKKQKKDEKARGSDTSKPLKESGNTEIDETSDPNGMRKTASEKRRQKRERRKVKENAKAARKEAKKVSQEQKTIPVEDATMDTAAEGSNDADTESDNDHYGNIDQMDLADLADSVLHTQPDSISTATPSPTVESPPFDLLPTQSGTSSISSIAPPVPAVEKPQLDAPQEGGSRPKPDPNELKARLQQRIDALRAARKADTLDGSPARNRQELMEARRRKEEQRKAHKKELRQKAKEEEQRQRDLALSRGSPLFSPATGANSQPSSLQNGPASPPTNFSFGRVAFADGTHASASLSSLLPAPKTKGPQDPSTALLASQNRDSRLSGLDAEKRADIAEKDTWLNAKKRAQGERVRDDSSLLKKTLKRKEKAKKKSEKEWGEREEAVTRGKERKQKKREDNLKKRREEKGKGKSGGKKGGKKVKTQTKARPGFEGSFRAKVGGGGSGSGSRKK